MKAAGGAAEFATRASRPSRQGVTTNAIGWLPGTDPTAGVLMVSAHLDHLGVLPTALSCTAPTTTPRARWR